VALYKPDKSLRLEKEGLAENFVSDLANTLAVHVITIPSCSSAATWPWISPGPPHPCRVPNARLQLAKTSAC